MDASWINEENYWGYSVYLLGSDVGVFEHQRWKNDGHLIIVNMHSIYIISTYVYISIYIHIFV